MGSNGESVPLGDLPVEVGKKHFGEIEAGFGMKLKLADLRPVLHGFSNCSVPEPRWPLVERKALILKTELRVIG